MPAPEVFALTLPIQATGGETLHMTRDRAGQIANPIEYRRWEDSALGFFNAMLYRVNPRELSPDAHAVRAGMIASVLS